MAYEIERAFFFYTISWSCLHIIHTLNDDEFYLKTKRREHVENILKRWWWKIQVAPKLSSQKALIQKKTRPSFLFTFKRKRVSGDWSLRLYILQKVYLLMVRASKICLRYCMQQQRRLCLPLCHHLISLPPPPLTPTLTLHTKTWQADTCVVPTFFSSHRLISRANFLSPLPSHEPETLRLKWARIVDIFY